MIKSALFFSLALTTLSAGAADCQGLASTLGAEYRHAVGAPGRIGQQDTMRLWRVPPVVVHEFPELGIAEKWFQVPDGRLKSTRYFDGEGRAIEYQPNDFNKGKGLRNWQAKFEIVPHQLLEKLTRKMSDDQPVVWKSSSPVTARTDRFPAGCLNVTEYAAILGGVEYRVSWLESLRLPAVIEIRSARKLQTWKLVELYSGTDSLRDRSEAREKYKEIDFGDIGDDETDPFFGRLINMGFIEHGASGFYDAHGHRLESATGDHHGHRH